MPEIQDRLQQILARIAKSEQQFMRPRGSVGLVAVSKTQPAEALARAFVAGQKRFGESYAQEALEKMEALQDLAIEWHFIGPIQSNKTRAIAGHFAWVHSVDRLKIAQRLSEQRPDNMPALQVLIQVNTSAETSKSGCDPQELPDLAEAVSSLPRLQLRGLMTIPAPCEGFEQQRVPFRALHGYLQQLQARGLALDTLSMGMSDDFEAAIAEGATLVRLGSALFGPRQ